MSSDLSITDVRFENFSPGTAVGIDHREPRISWRFYNATHGFQQQEYELQLSKGGRGSEIYLHSANVISSESHLVPWPFQERAASRTRYSIRVRARGKGCSSFTSWSESAAFETGLLVRSDWDSELISAPWAAKDPDNPKPEDLYRKEFSLDRQIRSARLYITAHGVYEAEINGQRIGDHFMAPGWASYDGRLPYQTYDVTEFLTENNAVGVRVAEGWFNGRLGFEGGRRNIWGNRTALLAQLEVSFVDGTNRIVKTDNTWSVSQGPIRKAEVYDGEHYDATLEIPGWTHAGLGISNWSLAEAVLPLPDEIQLARGTSEPVRRTQTLTPIDVINTPSGKSIVDFGQNVVGYTRISKVRGPRGHRIVRTHAEVLEDGELGTRPLRICKAQDSYTLRGDRTGETYEPRFTFHGFRYVQVDGWPSTDTELADSVEAVVCHTDMEETGTFSCSENKINQLFSNVRWSMRGNFLSVPTDCPQRDERMGWTGDLVLFASTATRLYGCSGMLRDWLQDVCFDQKRQGGIPPMVSPNVMFGDAKLGHAFPLAIWNDVTILAPWALWEEVRDESILAAQYDSMATYLSIVNTNQSTSTHLWDFSKVQLGVSEVHEAETHWYIETLLTKPQDWLDPNAPPSEPHKAATDPLLVANAFLIYSLDHMVRIAAILNKMEDVAMYKTRAEGARTEFLAEYATPNGRLVSDSQTAYALAICFDLLPPARLPRAGARLAELVRRNHFRIASGFAGTPFVCEALYRAGFIDVAYGMLLNESCPSWLYPISMGATTIWERWDSMLPNGTINSGEMTSFNHYAYGAVAKFLLERVAGLQRVEPGWKRSRVQPEVEGPFTWAKTEHLTPYGKVSSSWTLEEKTDDEQACTLKVEVVVPPTTQMEIVLPSLEGPMIKTVGAGSWSFNTVYNKRKDWPVKPITFWGV